MFKTFKSVRRDYLTMLAAVVILLGTFVIGGITYTYMNRPADLIETISHVLNGRELPADL
jgi:hypothetical protein